MDAHPTLVIPFPHGRITGDDVSLKNQRRVAEYSVTANREILLDSRTNARFLIEERVDTQLNIDLKKGIESITRQSFDDECLNILLKWACMQNGDNLIEIYHNSDFVGWQGTFRRIANAFYNKDSMGIVAIKVDGVIFLSETTRAYAQESDRWVTKAPFYMGYCPFKFNQIMTTDSEGKRDHDDSLDNRPSFNVMVRSELINSKIEESISLCVGSSVEAMNEQGRAVEFRALYKWANNKSPLRNMNAILRCDLTDLDSVIFGYRDDNFMLEKTKSMRREDFCSILRGLHSRSYEFLFDILKGIKKFLSTVDVDASVVELPVQTENGLMVQITASTKEETKGILTDEFKRRFNVSTI